MKYFYYISAQKVSMLKAQLERSRFSVSSISSHVALGPATMTISGDKLDPPLVIDTANLIKALEKAGRVKPATSSPELSTDHFYYDRGQWHNGLFAFETVTGRPIITYALWRELDRALIILVGSPNNILGDKIVAGDCLIPGTSGAHLEILDFVSRVLRTDEPVAVRVGEAGIYGADVPVPELTNSEIVGVRTPRAHDAWWSSQSFNDSFWMYAQEQSVALGLLCLERLRALPRMRMELLFHVYSKHDLPREEDLHLFGSWRPEVVLQRARQRGLFKYTHVIFGSPVYTAIV